MVFAQLDVQRADAFYLGKDAAAWERLTSDGKDALSVTYYKVGGGSGQRHHLLV